MDRPMLTMVRPYVTSHKIVPVIFLVFGFLLPFIVAQTLDCFNDVMTNDDRHIFLDFHNEMRRKVAHGLQHNVDELMPTASNMYKMKWSCILENEVNERLNRCESDQESLEGFGLNMNEFSVINPDPEQTPTAEFREALEQWWSVLDEHWVNEPRSEETAERFQKVANMLSSRTTQMGCSYAYCDKYVYVGCMYHLNGSTDDEDLYTKGPFCVHDDDCTTYKPSRCSDGLCIKGIVGR